MFSKFTPPGRRIEGDLLTLENALNIPERLTAILYCRFPSSILSCLLFTWYIHILSLFSTQFWLFLLQNFSFFCRFTVLKRLVCRGSVNEPKCEGTDSVPPGLLGHLRNSDSQKIQTVRKREHLFGTRRRPSSCRLRKGLPEQQQQARFPTE